MFEPLVSIITPTYNHGLFIRSCIESLLSQSYSNWEQIIVDDGSTDDTGEIISKYSDPRIRYERQPNLGPFALATTYNRALSLAKGELIAILEGDDFWPSAKLTTLVPAFVDPEVVLAYGEAADVNADGEEQQSASCTTRLRKKLSPPVLFNTPVGTATHHMLLAEGRSLVSPSTVILRRNALERIGGFQYVPGLPLTDYPTFIELSLVGTFYYSPQTTGFRRRHEHSITVNHARTIHEKVSEFTSLFLTRHRDKIALTVTELTALQENWRRAQDKLHFTEGRTLLRQSMWAEARTHFRSAITSNKPSVRVAAAAGLLFSWLHMDIEPLMTLGGRSTLRVRSDEINAGS
jgi:glycosyltransferase involved in cell wall biosynthesis